MRYCAHCGVRLGLFRHSYAGKEFCAQACASDYQKSIDRVFEARLRQWWNYLYGQRP